MLRIIHSIPKQCPDCGSENLGGEKMLLWEESNTLLCHVCGIIMVLEEPYDDDEEQLESGDPVEISSSLLSCPHCCAVDEIQVAEGEEWCSACGLDPNRTDIPVEELAHLWKEGSGIQQAMKKGIPKITLSRMYRFLTNRCGPHCSVAQFCSQGSGEFVDCIQEEVVKSKDHDLLHIEGDKVSKGKRKRNRKAKKKEEERIRKEKERAVLVCSSSGWYHMRYYNETKDPQKSTHTGSGSGT